MRTSAAALLLAAALGTGSTAASRPDAVAGAAAAARPNLLLITIDTLRPDRLSCYSTDHVETPVIDALARRGVLFRRAFAHTPTTLPSHTNILLGTTPLHHGVHDNSNFVVGEEFLTLAEHLKGHGYATGAVVGAFPLDSRFGLTQGFDLYDDNYGSRGASEFSYVERKAEDVVDKARAWLEGRTDPWFLWVHCFDPHQRYEPPEPFLSQHKDNPYNGEVAYVDFALGGLFEAIRRKGAESGTVVVFTGDHGESLGEHGESTHGYFAYNSTLWVPLIIAAPGLKPGESGETVCHIDIFPTVCDLLGVPKPRDLQGVSLVPALAGKRLAARNIYFESLYPHFSRGWAPLRGIISGRTKYIDSPIPELYDLEKDFNELENLAGARDLKPHAAGLKKTMDALASATAAAPLKKLDRAAQERLRSLGYVSGPIPPTADKVFTREDDLKVLLPYQSKLQTAMGRYHKGALGEATALLREIIAERKDFDLAYTYLATIYKEQARWKEALDVLREGHRENPSGFRILTTFGLFLTEAGQHDAAIEILRQGLDIIDYDPELWNYLGIAYWNKGDFAAAADAYDRALALDHNYPIVINNLGSLHFSLFLKDGREADYRLAVEHFRRAIELDPTYASPHNGLGTALAKAGDLAGAVTSWEKAVALDPKLHHALYNLGAAYLAQGDKGRALDFLLRYKKIMAGRLPPREARTLDELIDKSRKSP
jgi:arylsulfatase A-like enzyme/Flp pilus assembly protein TadD